MISIQNITNIYKSYYPNYSNSFVSCLSFYLDSFSRHSLEKMAVTLTPPSNRGVMASLSTSCKDSFKINVLLDWLTVSFTNAEMTYFFKNCGLSDKQIFELQDPSFEITAKFYKNSYKFLGKGKIHRGMHQICARDCLLELTGSSIQKFKEIFKLTDLQLLSKIKYSADDNISKSDSKITRIDLTFDYIAENIYSGLNFWEKIITYLSAGYYKSRVNRSKIKFVSNYSSSHVQTIYVGSRSSDKYLCMYLKHEECKEVRDDLQDNFIVRFELRIAENHAYNFHKLSQNCKNLDDFFNLIKSFINDHIEFKEPCSTNNINNRNSSRLEMADFWKTIFADTPKVCSLPVQKYINYFGTKKYVDNVSLSLYKFLILHHNYFEELYEMGKKKFEDDKLKNIYELNEMRKQLSEYTERYVAK